MSFSVPTAGAPRRGDHYRQPSYVHVVWSRVGIIDSPSYYPCSRDVATG